MPSLGDPAVALAMQLAESIAAGSSSAAREVASSALAPALAAVEGSWRTAGGKVLSMTVQPSGQLILKAANGVTLASGSLAVRTDGSTASLTFANGTTAAGTVNNGAPSSIAWSRGGLGAWTQKSSTTNGAAAAAAAAAAASAYKAGAKSDKAKAWYSGKTLDDKNFNSEANAHAHEQTHMHARMHELSESVMTRRALSSACREGF